MSLDLSTQEYARSEKTLSLACRLSGAIAGLKSFSEFLTEPAVPADVADRRQKICQNCSAVDTEGVQLFREFHKGVFLCGAIFLKKPLRIPAKDGCGCVLNLKWHGANQRCPLNLWPDSEVKPRKRCCGQK